MTAFHKKLIPLDKCIIVSQSFSAISPHRNHKTLTNIIPYTFYHFVAICFFSPHLTCFLVYAEIAMNTTNVAVIAHTIWLNWNILGMELRRSTRWSWRWIEPGHLMELMEFSDGKNIYMTESHPLILIVLSIFHNNNNKMTSSFQPSPIKFPSTTTTATTTIIHCNEQWKNIFAIMTLLIFTGQHVVETTIGNNIFR